MNDKLAEMRAQLGKGNKLQTTKAPLCQEFKRECVNWTIPTANMEKITEGQAFFCDGINFQCSFRIDEAFGKQKGSVFNVKAHLANGIKSVKFFFTMYCKEKDAKFRRIVHLSTNQPEAWRSKDFWLPLQHRDYDQISMDHYIRVLQIQYQDEEVQPTWNAEIKLDKVVKFECNLNKSTMQKMFNKAKKTNRWYFESDLFDSKNRNWALRAYPKGDYYDGEEFQKGLVVWPKIFFLPHDVEKMVVRCTTTNSVVDKTEYHVFTVTQDGITLIRSTSMLNCIPYEKLGKMRKMQLTVEFEILRTYYFEEDGHGENEDIKKRYSDTDYALKVGKFNTNKQLPDTRCSVIGNDI